MEGSWYVSDYYSLQRYDTSRDGSVVSITGERACLGGLGCLLVEREQSVVQGSPGKDDQIFDGTGWLSGNGRYLFSVRVDTYQPLGILVDLETGQQRTTGAKGQQATTSRIVADNGTAVVFQRPGSLSIVSIDGRALLSLPGYNNTNGVIDASGQIVLYTASLVSAPRTIRLFNVATHEDRLFLQGYGDTYDPAISADGKRVTFISTAQFGATKPPITPQLYAVNQDGTALRTLTSDPDGVLTYTLSDDGQVVWYVSNSGRVVKVIVGTGEAEEKISSTPQMRIQLPYTISPGSALALEGVAIPTSNVQVHIYGLSAPILSLSPSMIRVQVPWEVPGNVLTSFEVIAMTSSPFDTSFRGFASTGTNPILYQAIHEDWSSFVSPDNPAHPGEVLNFYATGLGPVDPPVPTGVPAPASPLSRTTLPISCSNATLLYSGLAPGLIGYYQFSVQLPFTAPSGYFHLGCTVVIQDIPVRP